MIRKPIQAPTEGESKRKLSIESLEDSTLTEAKTPKVMRFQNGKKVEVATDELPTKLGAQTEGTLPINPPRGTISVNKDTLWPLFYFDVKNRIVLDSAISILFDTIDAFYDDDSKVDMSK